MASQGRKVLMENEFDLRSYIRMVIKHRWLIVATTVLAALAALFATRSVAPVYEATAGILIAQAYTRITFDPRFQTVESDIGRYTADREARRWALAALVQNGQIAAQVAERLDGEMDTEKLDPARLLAMVSGRPKKVEGTSVAKSSDFIEIRVAASDPVEAALVANAWAEIYVDYVNSLYSGGSESYDAVQRQVFVSFETYERAEQVLVAFIAGSQIDDLNWQIQEKQQLINELQASKQSVFTESVWAERVRLSHYYAASEKLGRLLEDARALKRQIERSEAPATAANELALILLKAQVFASSEALPDHLEVQIDLSGGENPGADDQVADIKALVEVVEGRLAELDEAIAEQSLVLLGGGGYDALALEDQPEGSSAFRRDY
jgi:uncharacterized protein involved in exopolysaccharide biosynthesis